MRQLGQKVSYRYRQVAEMLQTYQTDSRKLTELPIATRRMFNTGGWWKGPRDYTQDPFPSHHGPSIATDQLPQDAMCYVGLAALISARLWCKLNRWSCQLNPNLGANSRSLSLWQPDSLWNKKKPWAHTEIQAFLSEWGTAWIKIRYKMYLAYHPIIKDLEKY